MKEWLLILIAIALVGIKLEITNGFKELSTTITQTCVERTE